jgi:hypothetical protein
VNSLSVSMRSWQRSVVLAARYAATPRGGRTRCRRRSVHSAAERSGHGLHTERALIDTAGDGETARTVGQVCRRRTRQSVKPRPARAAAVVNEPVGGGSVVHIFIHMCTQTNVAAAARDDVCVGWI